MRIVQDTVRGLTKGSPLHDVSCSPTHSDCPGDVGDFVHVKDYESVRAQEVSTTLADFELLQELGSGAYATVHLVRHYGDGHCYAMKVLTKKDVANSPRPGDPMRELDALKGEHRPLLVNLHFSFQTETKLFFMLDYMPGGNLYTYTAMWEGGRLPELTTRYYGAQVYLALESLHDAGILHRDLKPENVLLDENGHARLADFGLSRRVGRLGRSASFVGTALYIAPEIIKGIDYGTSVDWWSYGVLLFNLLTGELPFYGRENDQIFDAVLLRKPVVRPRYGVSSKAKDLVGKLLEKDEKKRIDGKGIRKHGWFRDIDWQAVEECEGTAPDWTPPVDMLTADSAAEMVGNPVSDDEAFKEKSSPRAVIDPDQKLFEEFTYDNTPHSRSR